MSGPKRQDPNDRFDKKIKILKNGCWKYLGAIKDDGYGVFSNENRVQVYAHRFSYERFKEKIPAGLVIDHLCRNRFCVNPNHLEAVTQRINLERGKNKNWVVKKRGICSRGHPQNEETTLKRPDGRTYCAVCRRERRRRNYAQKLTNG